ncbi:MAG: hypothetical protein U9R50_03515 [Campylobacterota bacterium]|nr:hypothetical protein [Campylobacterota bacterium]
MEISTIMMIIFIIALIVSMWKIYVFLPNETLADDDVNPKSTTELESIMLACIHEGVTERKALFNAMKNHELFDEKHYWRFNENRLNHLIHDYLIKNPELKTIEDIRLN